MISPVMLALYQFCSGMSSEIGDVDNTFHYYQQTYNLIESIINWDNSNIEFWLIISEPTSPSDPEIKCKFLDNVIPKLLTRSTNVSFTDTRNFAALFFTDNNNDEKQLNMSLKLPPDVIKIYLNHNGCQLDEAKLADIVDILWASAEISFIYYISFCNCSITDNYGSVDDVRRRPHKDIHGCIINLFYHQPFVRNKSGQWGVLTKMPLINEQEGVERQLINTSSQAFHYFPFQRKHNLNFNQMNMTVILFESANAYLKQEMNIFRYKLSASILENPHYLLDAYFGMDAELLRMLKTTLNFTVNISPTSDRQLYGFRQADGSFNGALGDIINRRADFIINGCFVKDYLTNLLEFTSSILDDKLCIVVKTASMVPHSLLIFQVFSNRVWIIIVITVITVAFAYYLLLTMIDEVKVRYQPGTFLEKSQRKFFYRKLCRKIKDDKSIAFRIIAIMLGASSVFGISTSHHERVFVSFCLLWSLILCGAFQGSLYNVYTTPKSYPNIDTLDDLYKSKLDIHVRHPGLLTDIFGDAPFGTTIGNLRTRRLKTTSDDFLNERIVSRGDVAGLTRFSNYDYDNKNLEPREDGASNLHVVAECPRSYTLAFLFRKRSIYINTVNWHINMFLQSGLTVKWQMESKHYFKLEAALKHHYTMMETKVKINLQHLEMAFVGLMLGHIVGVVVFLLEKYFHRMSLRQGKLLLTFIK